VRGRKSQNRKIAPKVEDQKYEKGSIYHLKMKNFMIFENQEITFQNDPQIISGPNGSGKSSIAAIGIALGVSEKYLSYTKKYGNFIKSGETESKIIISLFDDKFPQLKCYIYQEATHKPARYLRYDGQKNWKSIDENGLFNFLQNYNININSLAVFLSQDRVSLFTSLDSTKMLQETLRVIDEKLYQGFCEYYDKIKKCKPIQAEISNINTVLNEKEGEIEKLSADTKKIHQNEQDQANLQLYEKRLKHVKYNELTNSIATLEKEIQKIDFE
jgi:chromosome segregation ATPase